MAEGSSVVAIEPVKPAHELKFRLTSFKAVPPPSPHHYSHDNDESDICQLLANAEQDRHYRQAVVGRPTLGNSTRELSSVLPTLLCVCLLLSVGDRVMSEPSRLGPLGRTYGSESSEHERPDYGVTLYQGRRAYMEDNFSTLFSNEVPLSLFGVYDGHGGQEVSKHCKRVMLQNIANELKSRVTPPANSVLDANVTTTASAASPHLSIEDLKTSLRNGFLVTDDQFSKRRNHGNCGSTAVVSLIQGSTLVVANAGDSRAILGTMKNVCKDQSKFCSCGAKQGSSKAEAPGVPNQPCAVDPELDSSSPPLRESSPSPDDDVKVGMTANSEEELVCKAIPLSFDHKPDLPQERSRIEALGGFVEVFGVPRVNGILATSRSLGDTHLKPLVSAEPEFVVHQLDANHDLFMLLASDGLYDVLSNDHAARLVYRHLVELSMPPSEVAQALVKIAYELGSMDNITALVIDLRKYLSRQKSSSSSASSSSENAASPLKESSVTYSSIAETDENSDSLS